MNPDSRFGRDHKNNSEIWTRDKLIAAFRKTVERLSAQRSIFSGGAIYLLDEDARVMDCHRFGSCQAGISSPSFCLDPKNGWSEVILVDNHPVTLAAVCFGRYMDGLAFIGSCIEGEFNQAGVMSFLSGLMISLDIQLVNMKDMEEMKEDLEKKDMLIGMTERILSSIDVNEVLYSAVDNISLLYPQMKAELWLSQDSVGTTVPVKYFTFQLGEDDLVTRAFMEGKVAVQYGLEGSGVMLASPLRGKQGTYGVLKLSAREHFFLREKDIEYISILSDTAGIAFENAQLYRQSQNLNRELLLINEMAQQLNKSLVLKDIFTFVLTKLIETYRAEYCAIIRRNPSAESGFVISASTIPEHQGIEIDAGRGEIRKILLHKESVILSDSDQGLAGWMADLHCRSLLGIPLISGADIEGALILADSRPHYFSFDDIKLLGILGQHMALAMKNASLHNEMERMAVTDTLTGLYNRKYLNDHIARSLEHDGQGSLVLIDIDHFKQINDTYGHKVGDKILVQVSEVLKSCIRQTDIAARWGGEELAVYLPRVNLDKALEVTERIRCRIMEITAPRVTISCGIAFWDSGENKTTVESLFHIADMAMYEAKHNGRNQIMVAN